jgi:hypothetical protein
MDADLDMANRTSQAPHIKWMRENKKMIRVLRVNPRPNQKQADQILCSL